MLTNVAHRLQFTHSPCSCGRMELPDFFGKPNRFESRFKMHYTSVMVVVVERQEDEWPLNGATWQTLHPPLRVYIRCKHRPPPTDDIANYSSLPKHR